MNAFIETILKILPDIIVYLAMAAVMVIAVLKCFLPVLRNSEALKNAGQQLQDGTRVKLARPVWSDMTFLGRHMSRQWRDYLQNAESLDAHGQPCDVEDYINEDTVIYEPGNIGLSEMIPGLFTTLGILGTFIGLAVGLSTIDFQEIDLTISRLIAGLGTAFKTSIVGLICSLFFNVTNKAIIGRAKAALASFVDKFYRHGPPRPIDTANQLVALQQEQVANLRQFSEELSTNLSLDIEKAVIRALAPVAQSMDRFIEGTTRQQIEGVRHIVNQFVMVMDEALDGSIRKLSETLDETSRQQMALRDDLNQASQIISAKTNDSDQMQRVARQVLSRFDGYIATINEHSRKMDAGFSGSSDLLAKLHNASSEQADYLAQLREHQETLEKYLFDYNAWVRGFAETLGGYSQAQRESLSTAAIDMREASAALSNSYHSFVENVQDGLSGALGMFDESIQRQTARITQAIGEMTRGVTHGRGGHGAYIEGDNAMRDDIRALTHAIQTLNIQLTQRKDAI